ncbi:alpha/beta hydrolase [Oricola sp.]|uniref:alpha/beta hydrolase n=1 Tax=Oricola sp. TaxID=1979950 RepID=UPI003BA89275
MALFRVTDWDDAYANGTNIPQGDNWPDAWVSPAAGFRQRWAKKKLDIAYGKRPRELFDTFHPSGAVKGLFIFVHGGYWVRLDKSYWSHLAAGAVANGWAVAMPSYPLCPEVRVRDIAVCIAGAVTEAARSVKGPIRLAGHSAGGQIVTRLVSENTPMRRTVLKRIDRVMSISGLHDLRPLLQTKMNKEIRLDDEECAAESPALLRPAFEGSLTCWVGANERSEFVRQNALLANIWRGLGVATDAVAEPDRHHFDVIDGLADPKSPLCRALFG